MLRHTNTGRVSVLNVTHFRRERERGIAVEEEKTQREFSHVKKIHEGLVIPVYMDREEAADPRCWLATTAENGLLRWVEPQFVDVSQEAEESAHLLTADGGGEVCDLDDISPRNAAHCIKWNRCSKTLNCYLNSVILYFSPRFMQYIQTEAPSLLLDEDE